jgi:hypothetical protein
MSTSEAARGGVRNADTASDGPADGTDRMQKNALLRPDTRNFATMILLRTCVLHL